MSPEQEAFRQMVIDSISDQWRHEKRSCTLLGFLIGVAFGLGLSLIFDMIGKK